MRYILALVGSRLTAMHFRLEKNEFDILFPKIRLEEFKKLPIKPVDSQTQIPFIRLVDYMLFLKAQPLSTEDQIVPAYFEQLIDGLVYELYFPDELHAAGCHFHEHLRELPDLTAMQAAPSVNMDEAKLAFCRGMFARLYDQNHPVRLSLFKLDTVPEVAIIEGKGK